MVWAWVSERLLLIALCCWTVQSCLVLLRMIQKERPRPNGNRDKKISRWQDKCFLSLHKNSMGASYWKWGKDKVHNVCSTTARSQPSMSLSPSSLLCYMTPVLMRSSVKRPTFTSASGMSLLSLFRLMWFHQPHPHLFLCLRGIRYTLLSRNMHMWVSETVH